MAGNNFLQKLNNAQLKAANHNKGPMLVLAGPGSGKTAVITSRIKNLIEKYNVPPRNILAVTFSKAAAKEMEERFSQQLSRNAGVTFSTLHSLCFGILRKAGGYEHTNILTESSKKHMILEILNDMNASGHIYKSDAERIHSNSSDYQADAERIYSNSLYYKTGSGENFFSSSDFGNEFSDTAKKLSDEISCFKSNNLAANFIPSEIIRPFFVPVFRAYENKKRSCCTIDFDDMLIYAFEILKQNPLLLNDLRKKYVYILADEFQDTNPLQYEILKLLASSADQNFFAVGDDDQSIYGFRGAVPSVMQNFLNDFNNAETVLLDINYRCHPEIIKTSQQLISFNKNRFNKKIIPADSSLPPDILKKSKKPAEVVVLKNFETVNDECRFICDELMNAVRSGKELSDIAVLYRNSYEAVTLTANLKMRNIPYTAKEKISNPFEHFIAMDIIAYIRTAVNLISEKNDNNARSDLLRIINKPLRYISRASLCLNPSDEITLLFISMYRFYSDKPYMYNRTAKLESDLRFIAGCPPLAAISYIRHAVGYEKYLKDYALEKKLDYAEFEAILSLLENTAADLKTNRQWLDFINDCHTDIASNENLCCRNICKSSPYGNTANCNSSNSEAVITLANWGTAKAGEKNALLPTKDMLLKTKKGVQIMTMHASKGLEFDTVFIPQLNAGFIPHAKALSSGEIEEERRLLYVGMTRAKNRLIISCDNNINEKPALPSPFFEEILPI